MKLSLELSPKSFKFIETRKKDLTIEAYINLVMENLFDETALSTVAPEDYNILEIVEKRKSQRPHEYDNLIEALENNEYKEKVDVDLTGQVFDYLSAVYKNKIPRNVFIKKCVERGVNKEDISLALLKYEDKLIN